SRAGDAEATRRALLSAATSLFARRGFPGATAERIARAAGVNKAMINYHFGGKRGLYAAIVRESFAALLARLEGVTASGAPPAEKLRRFIAMFAQTVAEAPDLPAMLLREILSGGEHVDRELFGFITSILGAVRGMVESGVREGSFRPVDPLLTHLSLMGSLIFFFATEEFRRRAVSEAHIAPVPPAAEDYVRHLQELVARGLRADAPAAGPRKR
ncbi:MAG TPA: TetR family transcriptional regulator, partial [Vicinamibacteria bacterium]|nr:TetR family transcriptional regulator [Vicinamibacteria bacterium]